MVKFETRIQKFDKKGEKTGWSYISITSQQAAKLSPGTKVSFRIKGTLDKIPFEKTAILPMGDGSFILPLNATMRKTLQKKAGDKLNVVIQLDKEEVPLSEDFIKCLKDDPVAYDFFFSLPRSHQLYFSKWIESAKTDPTKAKRIAMAVIALGMRQGYSEMIRANKGR